MPFKRIKYETLFVFTPLIFTSCANRVCYRIRGEVSSLTLLTSPRDGERFNIDEALST
jgi:hypothetical protein